MNRKQKQNTNTQTLTNITEETDLFFLSFLEIDE